MQDNFFRVCAVGESGSGSFEKRREKIAHEMEVFVGTAESGQSPEGGTDVEMTNFRVGSGVPRPRGNVRGLVLLVRNDVLRYPYPFRGRVHRSLSEAMITTIDVRELAIRTGKVPEPN